MGCPTEKAAGVGQAGETGALVDGSKENTSSEADSSDADDESSDEGDEDQCTWYTKSRAPRAARQGGR